MKSKVASLLLHYREFLFSAVLLSIPFLYIPIVADPAQTPVFIISLLAFLLYSLSSPVDAHFSIGYNLGMSRLVLLYGILALYSLTFISFNSESTYEFFHVAFFVCAYFFFSRYNQSLYIYVLISFIGLGGAYLTYGYIEYTAYYNIQSPYSGLYEIRAHIGHKNLLAMYLCTTFPLVMIVSRRICHRLVHLILRLYILLAIVLIFMIQSRVGIVGLALFLMGYTILFIQKKSIPILTILSISLVLMTALYLGYSRSIRIESIVNRAVSIVRMNHKKNEDNESKKERLVLWKKTIELIQDKPFIGYGLGQWKLYAPSKNLNDTRVKFGNIIFQQPHNDYLWVASELGVLGLIVYALLLAYPICVYWKRWREYQEDSYYWYFIFLLIFAAISIFDFPKERPLFLMIYAWVLSQIPANKSMLHKKWIRWTYILVLIVSIIFFSKRLLAENIIIQIYHLRKEKNFDKIPPLVLQSQHLGVDYDHTSTPLYFYTAEAYYFRHQYDSAIAYTHLSLGQNPYHLYTWNNLGSIYLALDEDTKAIMAWNQSLALAEYFAEPRLNMAMYYMRKKDYKTAEDMLHFPMENESIQLYSSTLESIIRPLSENALIYNRDSFIANELLDIQTNPKRWGWLLKTFQADSLDFQTQVKNDIVYSLSVKKKLMSKSELEKRI